MDVFTASVLSRTGDSDECGIVFMWYWLRNNIGGLMVYFWIINGKANNEKSSVITLVGLIRSQRPFWRAIS